MKQILILALVIAFLPLALLAIWIVFSDPDMLDAENDYPILDNNNMKGALS